MRRSQLDEEIRTFLPYDNQREIWTDSMIHGWINDAIDDMCIRGRCYPKKGDVTLAANTIEYDAPTDPATVFVADVQYNYGDANKQVWRSLDKVVTEQLGAVVTQDVIKPLKYKPWGDKIYIYPALTNKPPISTVQVFYYAKDDGLTSDSDAPSFPEVWHYGIVLYVLWKAYLKEERYEESQMWYNAYISFLGDLKTEFSQEFTGRAGGGTPIQVGGE